MTIDVIRKVKRVLGLILETAGSLLLWGIAYFLLLFKSLPGQTAEKSLTVLFGLVAVWTVMVFEECYIEKKKWISGWLAPAIPFGVYTVLAYRSDHPALLWSCLGVSLMVFLLVGVRLFMRPIENPNKKLDILASRISRCIRQGVCILTCVLMVLMIAVISVNSHRLAKVMGFTYVKIIASSEPVPEYTFEKNIDMFLNLEMSTWRELPVEEKLETLQQVLDIETHTYLGIQEQITVQAEPLEYTLGEYLAHEKVIRIDSDHLENDHVECVMDTLLQEIFEVYTQKTIDKGCDDYVKTRLQIYSYNAAWYTAYQNGTPLGG